MREKIRIIFCFLLFTIFNAFSLEAEEDLLTLKQQLDRLQRDVKDISQLVFKNPKALNELTSNNNIDLNLTAIDMRIYDLEKDIKNLTMNIEEITFELDDIRNQIINFEDEIKDKLENIKISYSQQNINSKNSEEEDPPNNSNESLGTLKISSENNNENIGEKDQVNSIEQDGKKLIVEELSPEDQFQKAFDQIRSKKYKDAKISLLTFIDNNSKSQLSGSAHYWLGELYLLEKSYREAALILAEGYQKYPKSIKAPDMLYKLSEALFEIGKNLEACNTLNKFSKDFSSHKLNNKTEKRKLEMSCSTEIE